ncbi:urease accessory protein UreF [Mycolicibacterium sp. S2-37]|uniref:urease accessory protein UreF n=1 Tax=Mycolicibacterium sp. S2-37 TaxID=2810297 RepID=UPI001A93E880|nr:urease accessory UreF family protein [Mycolicibacterium sp. S2-37]MBO0681011.1 urease accessory protein UreF [Mycolicibacterium sp. S2-37]
MTDASAMLAWLQLHDSAFPSGRFVHSNGTEAWLAAHPDATDDDVCALADSYVGHSVASLDAVITAHAWGAASVPELLALDELTTSYKLSASSRIASSNCGRQLATAARHMGVEDGGFLTAVVTGETDGNLAVAEAVVARALDIDRFDTVLGAIRSAYSGVLTAGVRLGRIGPMRVQRALLDRRDVIVELSQRAVATALEDVHSTTPELEVYAIRHETASARMFTT